MRGMVMQKCMKRIITIKAQKLNEFRQSNWHIEKLILVVELCRFRIQQKISSCNIRNNSIEMIFTNYLLLF